MLMTIIKYVVTIEVCFDSLRKPATTLMEHLSSKLKRVVILVRNKLEDITCIDITELRRKSKLVKCESCVLTDSRAGKKKCVYLLECLQAPETLQARS